MAQTSSQGTVNKIEMRLREKGRGSSLPTRLCRLRNAIIREVGSAEINLTKKFTDASLCFNKSEAASKDAASFHLGGDDPYFS